MSGKYADDHASAYADVLDAGAAVSFALTNRTQNGATAQLSTTTLVSIAGAAMELSGNLEQYAALGLLSMDPVTLFFVPKVYGDHPPIGSMCVWNGKTRTVKTSDPFSPDGTLIFSKMVIV